MANVMLKGNWNELRGRIQQKWGRLSHDDLDVIQGRRDELIGRLQQRYQYTKERAEREVNDFTQSLEALGAGTTENVMGTVDTTVRRYPFATIGVALLLGLAIGLFIIPVGRK